MGRRRPRPGSPSGPTDSLHFAVVADEKDLHHLTAEQAELQLESFLLGWSRQRPGAVVRVITGRGNRSARGPVLQPRVRALLAGRLARFVEDYALEPGAGAFRVRVKSQG
jgi:DNA-nicking Smr family endonuclease